MNTLNSTVGRQRVLAVVVAITLAQFAAASTPNVVDVEMPVNSQVIGGDVTVTTAFDTGTTDVLDVGDDGVANRYANDINLKSAARTAITPTGFLYTSTVRHLRFTRVPVGTAATTGAIRAVIQYVQVGREDEVQG